MAIFFFVVALEIKRELIFGDLSDNRKAALAAAVVGRIKLARQTESPLERLERMVHPWSSYLVLPLFALIDVGVALIGGVGLTVSLFIIGYLFLLLVSCGSKTGE